MKLTIFSHKICYSSGASPTGFITDGGFPSQVSALSDLFAETRVVVPCGIADDTVGLSSLSGKNMTVVPLSVPGGKGFTRKIGLPIWLLRNGWILLSEVKRADAVHAPIPGDVGTFGMLLAYLFKKPLFVRHCGNWMVQRTTAELFWKWALERYAGGRNVVLATGGGGEPPSEKNENIKWIFSTSLRSGQVAEISPRNLSDDGSLRLVIACRQEERKGTDIVIASLPLITKSFPKVTLDVLGEGSLLTKLKYQADSIGVADRVTFHGKVQQSGVQELLRQADIFCYPTTASEGFPKVVVEALACGLPVITTRVSVLPFLIGPDCGLILDRALPPEVANAVKDICSDGARYQLMSANAITIAAGYTLENWREIIKDELRKSWGNSLKSSGM